MLKLLLATVLLAVAYAEDHECRIANGKTLTTFSGLELPVRFGCKVHAIRNTRCGDYRITVSPTLRLGNTISDRTAIIYYIDKLFINATHLETGEDSSGRTTHKSVEMYLHSMESEALDDRGGAIDVSDTFDISGCRGEVNMTEKNGQFTITYSSYDYHHAQTAGFSFTCHSDVFEPSDYDRQMCGNLQNDTAVNIMGENRMGYRTFLVGQIFTKKGIAQTERFCDRAQDILTHDNCDDPTRAVKVCTPILYDDKFIKCSSDENDHPDDKHAALMDFFKGCVQYVCGMSSKPSCKEFKKLTKDCPRIADITNKVQCRE